METVIVMVLLLSLTSVQSRPQELDRVSTDLNTHFKPAPKGVDFGPDINDIPDYRFEIDGSGNYIFAFNTFDLKRYEVGEVKNPGTDKEILVVRGKYSTRVVDEEGEHIIREIGYIADEKGFQPFDISLPAVSSQSHRVPGAPQQVGKEGIASAALATLNGGNFG